MLGYLDRFSVDLDFDLLSSNDVEKAQNKLVDVFQKLDLEVKDRSKVAPQFFVRYKNPRGGRNTIKIDCAFPAPKNNKYELKRFKEIQATLKCQTVECMLANKLVALKERYENTGKIAGRDLYDIFMFLSNGVKPEIALAEERRAKNFKEYIEELIDFINKKITQKVIDEDINLLLDPKDFKKVRKSLKADTLILLHDFL